MTATLSMLRLTAETTTTNYSNFIMMVVLLVVLVVFMVFSSRSQKKQEKKIAEMRDNLKVGDEITTIGGIIGKIVSVKDETVLIETGHDRNKIRLLRSAIKNVDVPAEDADN